MSAKSKRSNNSIKWYIIGLFVVTGLGFYFLTLKKDRIPASAFIPSNSEVVLKINPTHAGIGLKDILQNKNFFEQSELPESKWPQFFNKAGINFLNGAYGYKRGEQFTAIIEITDSIQLAQAWEDYNIADTIYQAEVFVAWNAHCLFISNEEQIKTDTLRQFSYDWANPKGFLIQGFDNQEKIHFASKVNQNNLELNYSDIQSDLGDLQAENSIKEPLFLSYHKPSSLDSLIEEKSNPFSYIYLSKLKEIEELQLMLNGVTVKEEQFISYEYDDNFNMKEVVTRKQDTVPNLIMNLQIKDSTSGIRELIQQFYPFGKYYISQKGEFYTGSPTASSDTLLPSLNHNELKINVDSLIAIINQQFNLPIQQEFQVIKEISGRTSEAPYSKGQLRIVFKNREQPLLLYLLQVAKLRP